MKRLLLALLLSGCGAAAPTARDPSLAHEIATPVEWNAVRADVGKVSAVADAGDEVTVFAEGGAFVFVSGALSGSALQATRWRAAAVVPPKSWAVAVDEGGVVYRVRDRTRLEKVTDRFALSGKKVTAVAATGDRAVFVADGELAIADGTTVRIFAAKADGVAAGGSGTLAARDAAGITKYAPGLASATRFPLRSVLAVAVDDHGAAWAATEDGVYAEQGGRLVLVYRASMGRRIHGLATSGDRVWFAEGGTLGVVVGGRVATVGGASFADDAALFGSPSGDVWVVDRGALRRYSLGGAASSDEARWASVVRPVFQRSCARCHLPDGPSGVDLSNAAAWRSMKQDLRTRLLVERSMPPRDAPSLADADRKILADWLGRSE